MSLTRRTARHRRNAGALVLRDAVRERARSRAPSDITRRPCAQQAHADTGTQRSVPHRPVADACALLAALAVQDLSMLTKPDQSALSASQ
jgi:hypothetical protein